MADAPLRPHSADDDRDPEVSDGEDPQAMRLFTQPTAPDVRLDPDTPAFDRVQDEKAVDAEYERDYNRRYVKEHGAPHGNEPTRGADGQPAG